MSVEIQFEPHISGDTWDGVPCIGPVLFGGVAPPNPVLAARMHFVEADGYPPSVKLATNPLADEAPILITGDPATWEFTIPPVSPDLFNLPPGLWLWGFKTWDSTGYERTLYHGSLLVTPSRLDT
jgi:hypothetical protein